MVGQSEVIVRAHHQDLLAFDDDLGILVGLNWAEIGVYSQLADIIRDGEMFCPFFNSQISPPLASVCLLETLVQGMNRR